MTITVNRKDFVSALKKLSTVIQKRNKIPILGYVKCVAVGDQMALTGTDLDIELAVTIDAQGKQSLTMPLAPVLRVASAMFGEKLTIASDGMKHTITCGASSFRLYGLPVDDFPELDFGELECEFTATHGVMHGALSQVQHAISTEETRYYLNGVYFDLAKPEPVLVAADGHRLALAPLTVDMSQTATRGYIVSRKTSAVYVKCFGQDECEVSFNFFRVHVDCGNISMTSKLVEGNFPPYQKAIPALLDGGTVVSVMANDLARAVKVCGAQIKNHTKFTFDRDKMALELSYASPDAGSATSALQIKAWSGADFNKIRFNAKYILDICQRYKGRELHLQLIDATSPCVIKTDLGDIGGLSVIMPIRV